MKYLGKITDNKDLVTKEYVDNLIALEYSASSSYEVDDCAIYNGKLYKCNTTIPSGEAWTPAHWTETNVVDVIQEGSSAPVTIFNPYTSTYDDIASIYASHNNSFQNCIGIDLEHNGDGTVNYLEIINYNYNEDDIRITCLFPERIADIAVSSQAADFRQTKTLQCKIKGQTLNLPDLKFIIDIDGFYLKEDGTWTEQSEDAFVFITDTNGTVTLPITINGMGYILFQNLPFNKKLSSYEEQIVCGQNGIIDISYITDNEIETHVGHFFYNRALGFIGYEEYIQTRLANYQDVVTKQDTLVSGTNIKTINNQSILGSGNLTIESGGIDTIQYGTTTLTQLNTLYTKHNNSFEGCVIIKDNRPYYISDTKKDGNNYIFGAVSIFDNEAVTTIFGVNPLYQSVIIYNTEGEPLSGASFIMPTDNNGYLAFEGEYPVESSQTPPSWKIYDREQAGIYVSNSEGNVPYFIDESVTMDPVSELGITMINMPTGYNSIQRLEVDHSLERTNVYLENKNVLPAIIKRFQCNNDVWSTLDDVDISYESGVNIKTINNQSILGSGNIEISSGITSATATLTVADWSNSTQTVTVTGVTSSNNVMISSAPASTNDYVSAGILCTAQGANSLTFTCVTVPTNDITVNVLIFS